MTILPVNNLIKSNFCPKSNTKISNALICRILIQATRGQSIDKPVCSFQSYHCIETNASLTSAKKIVYQSSKNSHTKIEWKKPNKKKREKKNENGKKTFTFERHAKQNKMKERAETSNFFVQQFR